MASGARSRDALTFIRRAFAAAGAGPEATVLHLQPGGVPIRVRLAGAEIARRLGPALAPLAVAPNAEEPTLDLRAFTGPGMPAPPWPTEDYQPRNEIAGLEGSGLRAAYVVDHGTVSVLEEATGRGVLWARRADLLPEVEPAPLQNLLHWGLRPHGLQLTHAAAVGEGGAGVLIAGPGGSGKSTSALASLLAGLAFVSDDYCLLEPGDEPRAHALYAMAKIDERSLRLLPRAADLLAPGRTREGKSYVAPPAASLARALALRAVVVPRVAKRTGRPVPLPPGRALLALAASTMFQLPGTGEETLAPLARLVRTLPAFRLDVGPDIDAVPEAFRGLLAKTACAA